MVDDNLLKLLAAQQQQLEAQQQQTANIQQQLELLTRLFIPAAPEAGAQNGGPNGQPQVVIQPQQAVLNSADQKAKNLADKMTTFKYDPDSGLTFEAYYKRYERIFTVETEGWTDAAKIDLLTQKLESADYNKFADGLLPKIVTGITLDEAVAELKRHFGYRETKFRMRYNCFKLEKGEKESFIDYSTRINKQGERFEVAKCSADDLKNLLFISGLKNKNEKRVLEKLLDKVDAQQKRLESAADDAARAAIKKLTLHDLVNEAERILSLKADEEEVLENTAGHSTEVFAVQKLRGNKKSSTSSNSKSPTAPRPCRFCGGSHWERDCDHVSKICETCKVVGHKVGFCTSAAEAAFKALVKARETKAKVSQVTTRKKNMRKYVTPTISGIPMKLQLDSGADISIISIENWKKLGEPTLAKCRNPESASGGQIPMRGSFTCHMALGQSEEFGTCYVTERPNINLLGNDWIEALGLYNAPLASVFQIKMGPDESALKKEAEKKFPTLFSSGLGLCTKAKVSLTLKQDAKPVFRKARNVPFGAEKEIDEEINRQIELGVFTPIAFSEFAAPIVVVRRKNGKVRICGDYSTGLNDALEPNKFPLPTIDQILANMAGKKIFSKIDLSDAYLQLEIEDEDKKKLTVNTHRGLFQVNRMQPGVKTASGVFQELMCKMLAGIDGVFAFMDDFVLGAGTEKNTKICCSKF